MTEHPYIAIEGVIGVGKTTLARYLQQALTGKILLEVFEENPFLSDFYADRSRYGFQTETFFLLSRYRQQHQMISETLTVTPLVSDYIFDKSWLFAKLNLTGDEWDVYESLYSALAERIPAPKLVVYLRASIDTLMERIAIRDRPYERDMQRAYIADLYQAYETFINSYTKSQVITIDTDDLNIVQDLDARQTTLGQIIAAITDGAHQPPLPDMKATISPLDPTFLQNGSRRISDFQKFHQALDKAKGFTPDLYINYILLTEEVGELASEITKVWGLQTELQNEGIAADDALVQAAKPRQGELASELADCMAYLLKIANYTGIDLEAAYIEKMTRNIARNWPKKRGLAHVE